VRAFVHPCSFVWRCANAEYRPGQISPHSVTITVDISRDHLAPAAARRAVERLEGRVDDALIPQVRLLVSELVTNSVKYGGEGAITLKVDADRPGKVRAEVIDQGLGFIPVARERPATEAGGWGLHLVQTLSDRWGVHEGSTRVWFEIER
jgi:anti-sigma regulatory factor (Ser/Thr protein kinase)